VPPPNGLVRPYHGIDLGDGQMSVHYNRRQARILRSPLEQFRRGEDATVRVLRPEPPFSLRGVTPGGDTGNPAVRAVPPRHNLVFNKLA